jgi:hypothetical protein
VSHWQPVDERSSRRYRLVVLLAIVAFATIVVVAFAITTLIGTGLD